jgi:glycosyltransferase involved in cell wall biosynthesis
MLVGDGELWGAIESLQTPNNLTIRLTHSIEYADLPEVYQRADVFVLPTLADTWALVVNEAMAVGLPILGSVQSQAVEEMVVDGINGWKFRGDDPEDSYRALCLVMDCPGDQLASMGKRARETAAAIGPDVFVSRVVEAIDRVCR